MKSAAENLSEVQSHWRPDIQGMRAIAVVVVVIYHAGLPVPGGFIGVDVFFVVSGFVITGLLLREHHQFGKIRLSTFFRRRFKRLAPALAVMVSITVLLSSLALSPLGSQQIVAQTAIGAMLLSANYVIANISGSYFAAPAETNPLLNTWSLSVEEQFYVVFPFALVFTWQFFRRSRYQISMALWPIGIIGGGSLAVLLLGLFGANLPGVSVPPSFYSPFARAWEFSVGAVLAVLFARGARLSVSHSTMCGLTGIILLAAGLFVISPQTPFPGLATFVPVFATALLIAAGQQRSNWVSRALSAKPLIHVGDRSYSIYLWHWPIMVLAVAVWPRFPGVALVAVTVSLIPALLSYRYVEQPLRKMPVISRYSQLCLVSLVMAVPILLGLLLLVAANSGFWNPRVASLDTRDDLRFGNADGCHEPKFSAAEHHDACTFNAKGLRKPVYLVGDSYAEVMGDALATALIPRGHPLTVSTYGGCPFGVAAVLLVGSEQENSPRCGEANKATEDWLMSQEPGVVFIANADFYTRDSLLSIIDERGNELTDRDEKTAAFVEGLGAAASRLKQAGHTVVVVQPIPNFRLDSDQQSRDRWDGISNCPLIRIVSGTCASSSPETLADIEVRQGPLWDGIDGLRDESKVWVLDLRDALCPDGVCSIERNGRIIYREYLHLTVDGAKTLAPNVVEVVQLVERAM